MIFQTRPHCTVHCTVQYTMPQRRAPPTLQLCIARAVGGEVIRALVQIETEYVSLKRGSLHPVIQENGVNSPPDHYTEALIRVETKYKQLQEYLEQQIPVGLINKIFHATTDVYTEKYNRIDQGDNVQTPFILLLVMKYSRVASVDSDQRC